MQHKNAIIVPAHPKDYHWAYQLLDSASEQENIIFVFSSLRDRRTFNRHCNFIIVPPKPRHIEAAPIYKKLEALRQLHTQYEYLSTLDTECLFLKPVTPYLKDIWDNNCLVANYSEKGNYHVEKCLEDLKITNYPYDTHLYWWFNDIQVYPTKLIPEFLDWLPPYISFDSFDYLLFGIFMIMKYNHPLKILNATTPFDSVMELMGKSLHYRHVIDQVNWSTWFPDVEKHPNIKMLFHLDRCPKLY